ncbi:MAG TPA: hypothetical protein VNN55_11215 [bacterium]|nr:hypothetical protein [bacterium]
MASGLTTAMLVFAGAAVVIAAINLVCYLPWQGSVARYWDEAALIQGTEKTGFPTGEDVIKGEYAVLKYGYALPYWCLRHWTSAAPAPALGMAWFVVMLAAPFVTPLFRIQGRFSVIGALAWVGAMLSLPIVNKYIGMANPTIQSMGLWLLLVLFYGAPNAVRRRWMIVPGLLSGLLILTDYKWLSFSAAGILAIELWEQWLIDRQTGRFWARETIMTLARRLGLTALWAAAVVAVAAIVNPLYLPSIIHYVTAPTHIDAFRPSLSWNLLIFLWVLGGFWAFGWTLWQQWLRRREDSFNDDPSARIIRRAVIMGAVICIGFSVIFWPRSARMFAPAVVIGLLVFARLAGQAAAELETGSRRARFAAILLTLILAGISVRALQAGDYYKSEDGIRKLSDFIQDHPDQFPPQPMGCYAPPIFRVNVSDAHEWLFLPAPVPSTLSWVVTSEVFDRVIIDEQYLFGNRPWDWRSKSLGIREKLAAAGPAMISFPCDFYASPYYLCESNYSDAELTFMLDEAREVDKPTWDLRYIGSLFGPQAPGVSTP